MGYFIEGFMMSQMALAMNDRRKDGETALEILDDMWSRLKDNIPDFEFNDEQFYGASFGNLLMEAFNPSYDPDKDEDGEVWYETVLKPFYERYKC